jgi:hypothetical protein
VSSFWTLMVEVVPEGQVGEAKIKHVVVTEHDARMASIRGERLRSGPLAQLLITGTGLMMSDGFHEHLSNWNAVDDSHGDVLIAGLGIGMILVPMLRRSEVRTVTVLEKSLDVIKLVEGPIRRYIGSEAGKLSILCADAYEWVPPKGRKWDCIYLDVWPNICTDNLDKIAALKRRYAKSLNRQNPKAWMRAWEEHRLRLDRRREKRYEYEPGFRCGGVR